MFVCPRCGHESSAEVERCQRCDTPTAPANQPAPSALDREKEIRELLRQGQKIQAIKVFRDATGAGLAEAKAAVEALERGEDLSAGAPPAEGLDAELVALLRQQKKINAIKVYRDRTNVGLKEAKDYVEALAQRHGIPSMGPGCAGLVLFTLLTAMLLTRAATAEDPAVRAVAALHDGVRTETLDNGLQVYLKPIPDSPVVSVMLACKVGSADEEKDRTGLSHYLEHLMFKGTEKLFPGDIDRITQRSGRERRSSGRSVRPGSTSNQSLKPRRLEAEALEGVDASRQGDALADDGGAQRRRMTHRLLLTGLLDRKESARTIALGPAAVWVSATPYIAFRHLKRSGKKRDNRELIPPEAMPEFMVHVLGEDLNQRSDLTHLPRPVIKYLHDPIAALGWRYRDLQFRRARNRPGDDGFSRPFGAFRLTFPEPVSGPLSLGYACHFGMGLFRPESSA